MCDVHVLSDESGDNEIVSIDNAASCIALLESAKNTGKGNLAFTINVQSDDSSCSGRSWNDSLHLRLVTNCSLKSLTLTINNFSPRSTGLSLTVIGCLEGCISLKSLTLTLNEYNEWEDTYPYFLNNALGRITPLISLTLILNLFTRVCHHISHFQSDGRRYVPNISVNSFTLTINDFSIGNERLRSVVLWSNYKSLTTLNLTINECAEGSEKILLDILYEVMNVKSLRTLRLKIHTVKSLVSIDFLELNCRKLVAKNPSLELIELTISRHGVQGSSLATLKWEKQ